LRRSFEQVFTDVPYGNVIACLYEFGLVETINPNGINILPLNAA